MKFIDPRIDFAFKRIFGSESAKEVLISFLESLLGLQGERCIAELTILDPFLAPKIRELKYSILDVRCRDHRGITYIVEMQVQKVAAFLKRIQFNAAKAYTSQIERGEEYPKLNQVIAITITDFVLFNDFDHCLSRHEARETITGNSYLQEILHVFVELPKFRKSLEQLTDVLEQWIYFIKYAGSLQEVPACLDAEPFRHAFEMARVANMSVEELELYEKAGIAITDARGAVELARDEGRRAGRQEGMADMLLYLLQRRFGQLPDSVKTQLAKAEPSQLEAWTDRLLQVNSLDDLFAG
ncbi:MAG: Rpn family recombination-promoting nuclease/putative transposase [Magnetococcales bacterium]|nr:Rpn family recombination-promoting nuclease/putative transposase [Magnetococcales bacterium]